MTKVGCLNSRTKKVFCLCFWVLSLFVWFFLLVDRLGLGVMLGTLVAFVITVVEALGAHKDAASHLLTFKVVQVLGAVLV